MSSTVRTRTAYPSSAVNRAYSVFATCILLVATSRFRESCSRAEYAREISIEISNRRTEATPIRDSEIGDSESRRSETPRPGSLRISRSRSFHSSKVLLRHVSYVVTSRTDTESCRDCPRVVLRARSSLRGAQSR